MEETENGEGEEQQEVDPFTLLENKLKGLQKGLLIAAVLAIAGLASPVLLLGGMETRLISQTSGPLTEMRRLETIVEEDFSNLNLSMEFNNHKMDLLSELITGIDPTIDRSQFLVLEEIVVSRERDNQYFFASLKEAIGGLAESIIGPRAWRDDFDSKLDLAIELSKAREVEFWGERGPISAQSQTNPNQQAVPNLGANEESTLDTEGNDPSSG